MRFRWDFVLGILMAAWLIAIVVLPFVCHSYGAIFWVPFIIACLVTIGYIESFFEYLNDLDDFYTYGYRTKGKKDNIEELLKRRRK